ncbi:MAG: single-stranded DNA-binding protein, partial [Candidatus Uhrbacteria bacterium]
MTLNKVMIIGNLTRDPEHRATTGGTSITTFGVATNRVWTNQQTNERQEEVEFHNVVAFGRLADICTQYLGRGRKVYVEGRLKTREWEGQDGVKRNRTEVVAENMIMLDRAPGGGTQQFNQRQPAAPPTIAEEKPPQQEPEMVEVVAHDDIKVEEIPF